MSIDRTTIGERLRLSRNACGLTQQAASASLGIARTTLVAMEKGDRDARPDELVALAQLYGVSVNNLLRKTAIHVDIVGQFRKGQGTESAESTRAVRLLHDLAAAYVELELCLGKPGRRDYPPEKRIGRGKLELQGEEAALELRARLGLGLSPVPDLLSLLEFDLGVRVFVRPLHSKIAGVYAYSQALGASILVNRLHPPARQRWTLAHELAHFISTRYEPSVTLARESERKHPDDVFADAFAAAFLMPSALVRRMFDEFVDNDGRFSARHLILGAHRLGVSLEAFGRQLEALDLLPQGTFDSLRDRGLTAAVANEVVGEVRVPIPSERGSRLMLLASEAHEKELLGEGQLAAMLHIDRLELRASLDALGAISETDGVM